MHIKCLNCEKNGRNVYIQCSPGGTFEDLECPTPGCHWKPSEHLSVPSSAWNDVPADAFKHEVLSFADFKSVLSFRQVNKQFNGHYNEFIKNPLAKNTHRPISLLRDSWREYTFSDVAQGWKNYTRFGITGSILCRDNWACVTQQDNSLQV